MHREEIDIRTAGEGEIHDLTDALLGPSLSVPVSKGLPMLGTWQQVILVDFDNKPRERRVLISVT